MSSIKHSSSVAMLSTGAMVASIVPGHDEGLCHHYHWARDLAAERRSHPRVGNPATTSIMPVETHSMSQINYAPDGFAGALSGLPLAGNGFQQTIDSVSALIDARKGSWNGISPEAVGRMRLQNR